MSTEEKPLRLQLLEQIEGSVREIGRNFEPDGDWAPVAFLQRAGGELIPCAMLGEHWTEGLDAIAREVEPQAMVVVGTQRWASLRGHEGRTAAIDIADVPAPSQRSESQEQVVLYAVDRGAIDIRVAPIRRREGQPPELGDFEAPPGGEYLFAQQTADLLLAIFGVQVRVLRQ